MQLDFKFPFPTSRGCVQTYSTFGLAAFVVRLQVEAGVAMTGVGPTGVQAGVFACVTRHFIALVNVHTGQSTGL